MSADEAVEEKSRRRRRRREEVIEEDMDTDVERGLTERKGRATRSRRQSTDTAESGNFLTRMTSGTRSYLSGVTDELDKVVWPSREETMRLAWIVLLVTAASAVVLGIISFIFNEIFVIGIREDNPIIFVAVGIVVLAGLFAYRRLNNQGRFNSPYS
jgi:preprotein translocase SecE subunit